MVGPNHRTSLAPLRLSLEASTRWSASATASELARLLDCPIEAQQRGKAARERVLERFLPFQHFEAEAEVIDRVS